MTNLQKEIINIISDYVSKNPNQRFGQLLFNLDINNFKNDKNEITDIYNDSLSIRGQRLWSRQTLMIKDSRVS